MTAPLTVPGIIGGKEVIGADDLVDLNPATGRPLARVAPAAEYALVAALWTNDVGRAHRLAGDVRAGQVFVNTYGAAGGIELPFGGAKRSGYGREKGFEGMLGYTQTKTVVIGLS